MEVVKVDTMPCGTKIQIENWHDDLKFMKPSSTLAAYPVSKVSLDGQFAPKRNRKFRATFNFENETETKQAFDELKEGTKQLIDFKEHINNPNKIACI